VGDLVEVVDGRYVGRFGRVREVDGVRRTVRVALALPGDRTAVELDFAQVARLEPLARGDGGGGGEAEQSSG
jgi:transcription antitermination factor NusG